MDSRPRRPGPARPASSAPEPAPQGTCCGVARQWVAARCRRRPVSVARTGDLAVAASVLGGAFSFTPMGKALGLVSSFLGHAFQHPESPEHQRTAAGLMWDARGTR